MFDPTVHSAIVARHSMTSDLGKAIDRGELSVLYQPIVALRSRAIVGVEALVRWRHPVRGLVEPDEFIPLAEESGTILPLGRMVLVEACRQAAVFDRLGSRPNGLLLTVNLSAHQLKQPDFAADLEGILHETGFPAERLVLEMTETAMFSDTHMTIARLEALRTLKVQIAIDDFGTGYSSLGYLRRFDVDILKIAKDFVPHPDAGPDEWAFAHAIVALGRTLDLRIIAEGIEQRGQLERLRDLGCELGQGYLFARPLTAAAVRRLLLDRPASAAARPAALPAGRRRPAVRLNPAS